MFHNLLCWMKFEFWSDIAALTVIPILYNLKIHCCKIVFSSFAATLFRMKKYPSGCYIYLPFLASSQLMIFSQTQLQLYGRFYCHFIYINRTVFIDIYTRANFKLQIFKYNLTATGNLRPVLCQDLMEEMLHYCPQNVVHFCPKKYMVTANCLKVSL